MQLRISRQSVGFRGTLIPGYSPGRSANETMDYKENRLVIDIQLCVFAITDASESGVHFRTHTEHPLSSEAVDMNIS